MRTCTPGTSACLAGEVCTLLDSGTGACFSSTASGGTGAKTGTTTSTSIQTGVPFTAETGTVTVLSDTNGDGKLSPGESGYLKVSITNTGTAQALGITGNLTTTTAGVTITGGTGLNFSDIDARSSACGTVGTTYYAGSCSQPSSYYPTVTLATSVTAGTMISFSLALADEYGSTFAVPFSVPVY